MKSQVMKRRFSRAGATVALALGMTVGAGALLGTGAASAAPQSEQSLHTATYSSSTQSFREGASGEWTSVVLPTAQYMTVLSPDGSIAYYAGTDGRIYIVRTADSMVEAVIPAGFSSGLNGHMLALSADGGTLYFPTAGGGVAKLDTGSREITATAMLSAFHASVAVTPDGSTVLVADADSRTLLLLDAASFAVKATIPLGFSPAFVEVTPDGSTALLVAGLSGDRAAPAVAAVDLATRTPTGTMSAEALFGPFAGFASSLSGGVAPDGSTLYVNIRSGALAAVDIESLSLISRTSIPGFDPAASTASQGGLAVNAAGTTVYFVNRQTTSADADSVYAYDVASRAISVELPRVTSNTGDLQLQPDPAPIAAFASTVSGATASFDASASSTAIGTVDRYDWDFGDGTSATTTTPTATHTYTSPGAFQVTLVVTNSAGTSLTKVFTGHTLLRNGGPRATTTNTLDIAVVAATPTPTPVAEPPLPTPTPPAPAGPTPTAPPAVASPIAAPPVATGLASTGSDIPYGALVVGGLLALAGGALCVRRIRRHRAPGTK